MNYKEFKSITIGDNICVVDEKAEVKIGEHYLSDGKIILNAILTKYPKGKVLAIESDSESKFYNLPRLIIKDGVEMLIGEAWEIINAEMVNGVNPHAFRLGFIGGLKSNTKNKWTDQDVIVFAKNLTVEWARGHSTESALKEYEKEKPQILLLPISEDGTVIVSNNEIIGYWK